MENGRKKGLIALCVCIGAIVLPLAFLQEHQNVYQVTISRYMADPVRDSTAVNITERFAIADVNATIVPGNTPVFPPYIHENQSWFDYSPARYYKLKIDYSITVMYKNTNFNITEYLTNGQPGILKNASMYVKNGINWERKQGISNITMDITWFTSIRLEYNPICCSSGGGISSGFLFRAIFFIGLANSVDAVAFLPVGGID